MIGQIYTNRAKTYHLTDDQDKAAADATYVLENINSANPKALLRRAHAARSKNDWESAARDYQTLYKVQADKETMKDLNFCISQLKIT